MLVILPLVGRSAAQAGQGDHALLKWISPNPLVLILLLCPDNLQKYNVGRPFSQHGLLCFLTDSLCAAL